MDFINRIKKAFHINYKDKLLTIKERIKSSNVKSKFNKYSFKNIKDKDYRQILEKYKPLIKQNYKRDIALLGMGVFFSVCIFNMVMVNRPAEVKYVITDNKAEDYYYAGEYEKAIEEYNSLILKDNTKENLWNIKIAEIYSIKGQLDKSKEYIEKVKSKGINDAEVYNYVIFTEFMNKDYDTALADGVEALKKYPDNKKIIKTMFTVYMSTNNMGKAKDIITSYPVDSRSAYDLAEHSRMLMIDGQWDEGFKELRDAWSIDKDEFKIYDVLSQIAVYNRDMILESVTNLSTKNPNDVAYKLWLAKLYSLTEETADQAEKILSGLNSEDTGKIESKLIESAILQNTKQGDKADKLMEDIIKQYNNDYRVLHAAGWYYLNKKDMDKANQYCRESIIKNKNYPDNYGFLMPEILKAQGKSTEGEPYFRTALYKEPYNYNIMLNIANYYWYTTKNSEKALEYFKFAEIVKPTDPEIKYNMALIHLTNKREDEAVNLLKQCIKLSDSTPKYHRTLGTIYLEKGKNDEAIKEIRYAYSADEADVLTLNNAGCYYIMVEGNLERGLYNLQKAAEGLNQSHDKYTVDTIRGNYEKAKKLVDQYNNSSGNEKLKVPDFILFY